MNSPGSLDILMRSPCYLLALLLLLTACKSKITRLTNIIKAFRPLHKRYSVEIECPGRLGYLRSLGIALVLLSLAFENAPAAPMPMRQSQQFTILDARPSTARSPGFLRTKSGQELLRLDVDSLLISAERVKEVLLSELGLAHDSSASKLRLVLYVARKPDELIGLASSRTPNGWEYRMDIPDQIESQSLVRGIVDGLLLEIANREQGPRSAELPTWLIEGFTAHIIAVAGKDLTVGSVPLGWMVRVVRERQGLDYLRGARAVLQAHTPLSFSQLVYPEQSTVAGENLKVYQACAQLFVYELLHMKDGPSDLVKMLRALPTCWNWEIAFLRGFEDEFRRMLDVEKKWSVDVLAFVARDPSQLWAKVTCLERLDEVLSVPAQVPMKNNQLPERKRLTIQHVITSWSFSEQSAVLLQRVSLLDVLRLKSPAELVPLIDSYRRTLAIYLQKRRMADRSPATRMQTTLNASLVAQDAIKDLQLLDKRREELRPQRVLSGNSPITR